ncbi:hypothetical protein MKZ38_008464 [Zalerion maritima]|uniref:Uncharacterized protein n=1 Tax=Zalerion maritima TaxID=339359 RepID=A0AAD5RW56_9PEZI|nr:hypothetical protein MKZ38_008464 [Zalerion maritima]
MSQNRDSGSRPSSPTSSSSPRPPRLLSVRGFPTETSRGDRRVATRKADGVPSELRELVIELDVHIRTTEHKKNELKALMRLASCMPVLRLFAFGIKDWEEECRGTGQGEGGGKCMRGFEYRVLPSISNTTGTAESDGVSGGYGSDDNDGDHGFSSCWVYENGEKTLLAQLTVSPREVLEEELERKEKGAKSKAEMELEANVNIQFLFHKKDEENVEGKDKGGVG